MAGKKKGKKAIKQGKYRDHSISLIDDHKRSGKTLSPPLLSVPITFNSWLDKALPDVLWATILASHLKRDDYLGLFRQVVKSGREEIEKYEDTYITHSALSKLPADDFDKLLSPVLNRMDAKEILAALRLFDSIPDIAHWQRHLPEPDPAEHWRVLARAVAECFDHQSEKATDCRWFKLVYMIAIGKMLFPRTMEKLVEEIVHYPNLGDMRSVRPSIRAAEMAFRGDQTPFGATGPWSDNFWQECWTKTACQIREPRKPSPMAHRTTTHALFALYRSVTEYFHSTLERTSVDARHDAAFGLVLYGIYSAIALSRGDIAFRAEARIILRTIVETFITLKYLSAKDDPTIWTQYRNYGAGQAKLSFLKQLTSSDIPEYVTLEELEAHANSDMWMEFQDINLGVWYNKNLRQMADEIGIKDIYDKYYDWPSGFVHANWAAVRDTTFELCLNPLHRFHRVASFPRIDMNDALVDAGKLVNLLLDELNKLYPPFKPRLKKSDRPSA